MPCTLCFVLQRICRLVDLWRNPAITYPLTAQENQATMKKSFLAHALIIVSSLHLFNAPLHAQNTLVPQFYNYQGRVAVSGTNFTGTGGFEFAIVNSGATTTYWSSGSAEVPVPVSQGVYSVLLGNTALTNMAAFGNLSFAGNTNLYLRVWFDDGTHGLQLLSPDQQISAVPFATLATVVTNAIPHFQVFSASGTFTVPANVTRIMVEAWGGGGGGGGAGASNSSFTGGSGGGGGGGGYAKNAMSVTPGNSLAVTVGAAGPGGAAGINENSGTAGTAGGASSLGSVTATGGSNGSGGVGSSLGNGDGGNGGNGGSGGSSPIQISGAGGGNGGTFGGSGGSGGTAGSGGAPGGSGSTGAGGMGGAAANGAPFTGNSGSSGSGGYVIVWG